MIYLKEIKNMITVLDLSKKLFHKSKKQLVLDLSKILFPKSKKQLLFPKSKKQLLNIKILYNRYKIV